MNLIGYVSDILLILIVETLSFTVVQLLYQGITSKRLKSESDFRRLIFKMYEAGYPCAYNSVKKEIILEVYPNIDARIIWNKSKEVSLKIKAKKKSDRKLETKYKDEINKIVDEICRQIKFGGITSMVIKIVSATASLLAIFSYLLSLYY